MKKQVIISIGREFGSGGHVIAERIAADFGLPLYNRNILDELAEKNNLNVKKLESCDEKPKSYGLSRSVGEHTYSKESILAEIQFDYIRNKADSGESFVIVGRCADSVLAGREGLITIFITGDMENKISRVMDRHGIERKEAINKIKKHDKSRKKYHDSYASTEWGASASYDLTVNCSKLGMDRTVQLLEDYIIGRMRE